MPIFYAFDDRHGLPDEIIDILNGRANLIAKLDKDGFLLIKNQYVATTGDGLSRPFPPETIKGTYVDLAIRLAQFVGADPNDPNCRGMICTCPVECDCQDHANGFVSNECPIHNNNPQHNPECPQHGENWIG